MALNAIWKSTSLLKSTIGLNSERYLLILFILFILIDYYRSLVILSQRFFSSKDKKLSFELEGEKEENSVALRNDEHQRQVFLDKLKNGEVNVDKPNSLSTVSGVPEEHVANRRVRIYKQAKNAMQSGTYDTQKWKLDYENRERWENPLMGWTSTYVWLNN